MQHLVVHLWLELLSLFLLTTISPNLTRPVTAWECPPLESEEDEEDEVGHVHTHAQQTDLVQHKDQQVEQVDRGEAGDEAEE